MTKGALLLLVLIALQLRAGCLKIIVGTCEQLEAAVHSASVTSIFVQGRIATHDCKWREEAAPNRNLEITGFPNSTLVLGGPGESRHIWSSGPDSIVNFVNLKILEGSSSLMGLDLDLFRDFNPSSIFLDRATLVLTQCALDDHMRIRLEKVVNNLGKNGIASYCSMSHHQIHVDSLIYYSKLGNSIHIADTTISCGNLMHFQQARWFRTSIKMCKRSLNSMVDVPLKVILPSALAVLLLIVTAVQVVSKKTKRFESLNAHKLGALSSKDQMASTVHDQGRWQGAGSIEIGLLIGKGNFSCVFCGIYDGSQVAIKILDHNSNLVMEGTDPLEAVIGRKLTHPNVVRTIVHKKYNWDYFCACGCFEAEPDSVKTTMSSADDFFSLEFNQTIKDHRFVRYLLVMEYCRCGSLHSFICKDVVKNKQYMHTVLQALIDVARAMEHVHRSNIIHGDLKTQNVLLSESEDSQRSFTCKVGDFGMSRFSDTSQLQISEFGSIKAMPPEVLTNGLLTKATDVYSYGILVWELLAGDEPYSGWSHQNIVHNVVAGGRPGISCKWPQCFVQLMEDCWQQSHLKRPSFEQILEILLKIDTPDLDAYFISSSTNESKNIGRVTSSRNCSSNFSNHIVVE